MDYRIGFSTKEEKDNIIGENKSMILKEVIYSKNGNELVFTDNIIKSVNTIEFENMKSKLDTQEKAITELTMIMSTMMT